MQYSPQILDDCHRTRNLKIPAPLGILRALEETDVHDIEVDCDVS